MHKLATVLKMRVAVANLHEVVQQIFHFYEQKLSSYVCVSNVHMCMEVFDDVLFMDVVNSADLVVADGRPIFWAQRLLGFRQACQVRGQDLMNQLCADAAAKGLAIGLYGGATDLVLAEVKSVLQHQFPQLQIVYCCSPPFKRLTDSEMMSIAGQINDAKVDFLFVGIGCPKQELWMAAQRGHVNSVMLGVGAAFDFISGAKNHAPKWMQYCGLEWLFRFMTEPARLWRRYLIQNPRFLYYFALQWLTGRQF